MNNLKVTTPFIGHGKGTNVSDVDCFRPGDKVSKHLGSCLPHWNLIGKLQFITCRLKDSLPQSKLDFLKEQKINISTGLHTLSYSDQVEILERIDRWLQQGYGSCIFKFEEVQKIIINALNFYDGKRYDLFQYVVMPNHIHFIVRPYEDLDKTISQFYRYTTTLINRLLHRKGSIWQRECFDRMIRSVTDFQEKCEYIKANPLTFSVSESLIYPE